jgi:hypothetical protein
MQIEQLKTEIEMLSDEDFERLRRWFAERDWQRWDRQLEEDVAAGKLDFLLKKGLKAKQEKLLASLGV